MTVNEDKVLGSVIFRQIFVLRSVGTVDGMVSSAWIANRK